MREFLIFCSDPSGFYYNPIQNFRWTTTDYSKDDVVFYTDRMMLMTPKIGKVKIGWVFEPEQLNLEVYNYIKSNYKEFDYIFTWDKRLCRIDDRIQFIPYTTSWISQPDYDIYDKTKLVSIIASKKNSLPGHILRHEAVAAYPQMDAYGRGYEPVKSLLTPFKDYAFTVAIENTNDDCNMSEKLVTPMLCGTIPIFYGCPSIGKVFNDKGILSFSNVTELGKILNSLSFELYNELLPFVKDNYERAKGLQLVDDRVYEKLVELKII